MKKSFEPPVRSDWPPLRIPPPQPPPPPKLKEFRAWAHRADTFTYSRPKEISMSVFTTSVKCAGCTTIRECSDSTGVMPNEQMQRREDQGGWILVIEYGLLGGEIKRRAFCSRLCAAAQLKRDPETA